MTGVGDDSRGRLPGAPWFVVGVALALAATVALVLADDIRYLRLGIVAALWAALVGAFLAVRYRKQATSTDDVVAQAQQVYELELEREVAARREYELEVENDIRAKAHADSRGELDALRAEVAALRDNLQSLFGGGEVLLERFALTAQATRMRALREEQRLVDAGPDGHAPQLMAGPGREPEQGDRGRPQGRPAGRPAAPEPRRPERSLDLPPRRVAKGEPARRGHAAASAVKAAAEARVQQTVVNGQPAAPPEPNTYFTEVADPTRPEFGPSARHRPSEPAGEPTRLTAPWEPAPVKQTRSGGPAPEGPPPPGERPRARPERSRSTLEPVPEPEEEFPESANPTLPVEVRRGAHEGRAGGRRRRTDDESPAEQSDGGGRRRRAEGEPPAWEALSGQPPTGSHAQPEPTGRRAAPEPEPSGSHSAGRSVSDLLAAYGGTDAIPRRRRRAED